MLEVILKWCQPIAIFSFLVSGVACLILKRWHIGVTNILFCIANFWVFYGEKITR